jgi:predicted SnoaL-like aldol condensation-catalyzing enzyme
MAKQTQKSKKSKKRGRAAAPRTKARTTRVLSRSSARTRKVVPRRVKRKVVAKARDVTAQLARNKQLVLEFYHKLIGEKDFEGARPYMGREYRQHAPYAADGHAGVAAWVAKFKEAFPQHHYEVKKVIAEGDFVVLHLHGKSGLHPYGESVVDIFRIEDGKVVEHWDVIQPIPESADNSNSMF